MTKEYQETLEGYLTGLDQKIDHVISILEELTGAEIDPEKKPSTEDPETVGREAFDEKKMVEDVAAGAVRRMQGKV